MTLIDLLHYIFALIALKAIFIGSEFNIWYAIKYKNQYLTFYFNRPIFNPKEKNK